MADVAVIRFPGSNCEDETLAAITRAGGRATLLDYRDSSLGGADAVVLPGGFSYGDYLRSGAIARFSPIMEAIRQHADQGGVVIGICNGFQILCEAHLLPGALLPNAQRRFVARPVDVRIENVTSACTSHFSQDEVVRIPVAHGDGRFVADEATLDALERYGQVVMRYVTVEGSDLPHNPNGSSRDIAGICNAAGNIVGYMPHPERLADDMIGGNAGHRFFTSLIERLGAGVAA